MPFQLLLKKGYNLGKLGFIQLKIILRRFPDPGPSPASVLLLYNLLLARFKT